ncbi:MAG TPA: D-aminoacylase [Planctomycetota bacterium]|nr:D-aminoacylase [Planctomycetota bacterium]
MATWTYVLHGGTLIDGTGAAPAAGDLAIADERIAATGELRMPADGTLPAVINCAGLAVAPGFIDVHTHSDLTLLAAPEASTHILQGVTTEVCGNCGWSAFPALGERAVRIAEECRDYEMPFDWEELPGFIARIERTPAAVNRALLVGLGAVRGSVLGYADREPSAAELEAMRGLVRRAMELGCLGLSSGLIYPPGMFARTSELVELARVAAGFGGLYASHVRGEGARLEAAVEEFLQVGRDAGLRVQFSHLKVSGQEHWHKIDWLLERLEAARSAGLSLYADRYPYTASETGLDVLLPAWAFEGGRERELARLKDRVTRARMEREVAAANPAPEFWEHVVVGSVDEPGLAGLQGRSIAEIAAERGRPPLEIYFEVLLGDECRTGATFHKMSEEHLERILRLDWVMVGSDSSARGLSGPTARGFPHPRGCGTFPRVVARYVREKKLLTLESAIRKMTGLPAEAFGLKDRGFIRKGAFADLVVFDPAKFADAATYRNPKAAAAGLVHLFVNGRPVVLNGKPTAERPGRLLRREGK